MLIAWANAQESYPIVDRASLLLIQQFLDICEVFLSFKFYWSFCVGFILLDASIATQISNSDFVKLSEIPESLSFFRNILDQLILFIISWKDPSTTTSSFFTKQFLWYKTSTTMPKFVTASKLEHYQ